MKKLLSVLLIASMFSVSMFAQTSNEECLIEKPCCITKEGAIGVVVAGALAFFGYKSLASRKAVPSTPALRASAKPWKEYDTKLTVYVPLNKIPSSFSAYENVPAPVVRSLMQENHDFSQVMKEALGSKGYSILARFEHVNFAPLS